MCNLYRHRVRRWEMNSYFGANDVSREEADIVEIEKDYSAPGTVGYVVREVEGVRQLDLMRWGFCTRRDRKRPAREGELPYLLDWWTNARNLEKSMWRKWIAQPEHRCLVPFTHFSEPKDAKDRAHPRDAWWFTVDDQEIPAFAGVWKIEPDVGPVYAFCTTEPNTLVGEKHPKAMPVILAREDHDRWLRGSLDDVLALQNAYPSQLMRIEA